MSSRFISALAKGNDRPTTPEPPHPIPRHSHALSEQKTGEGGEETENESKGGGQQLSLVASFCLSSQCVCEGRQSDSTNQFVSPPPHSGIRLVS